MSATTRTPVQSAPAFGRPPAPVNTLLQLGAFLGGGAGGAGAMYFWDPGRGKRRRRVFRDRATHALRVLAGRARRLWVDALNHGRGVAHDAAHTLREESVPDDVLVERVRARLGHLLRHTHHIEVIAQQGVITLRGRTPLVEADRVIYRIEDVPGVKAVINRLVTPGPRAASRARTPTAPDAARD